MKEISAYLASRVFGISQSTFCGRARQGSNLKPLAPEANALSIELRAQESPAYQRLSARGLLAVSNKRNTIKLSRAMPPAGTILPVT